MGRSKKIESTSLYLPRVKWSGKRDSNSQPSAWKADALPIELFPPLSTPEKLGRLTNLPCPVTAYNSSAQYRKTTPTTCSACPLDQVRGAESTSHKVVEGGGFEPPKAPPTDLQSVPFDRSGIPPLISNQISDDRGRKYTLLYKLNYNYRLHPTIFNTKPISLCKFTAYCRQLFCLLTSVFCLLPWSWRWDLNPQPADYKSAALPIELRQQKS